MEINKHNYQEIELVKQGDRIVFDEDHVYTVTSNYLNCCGKGNEAIFHKIGVARNKLDFCGEAYGYTPKDGYCPEYCSGDYAAALRLIKKIFDKMYPKLKKKQETTFEETLRLLDDSGQKSSSKPIKVGSTDQKFTIKVSKIKPKIIL